jgi:hypothetical protein
MNETAYVVVYSNITKIRVKNYTDKGVRDANNTFYQDGKIYSGYGDTTKLYRTQRVVTHLTTAKKLAREQCESQIEHLQLEIETIFKDHQRVVEKRYF